MATKQKPQITEIFKRETPVTPKALTKVPTTALAKVQTAPTALDLAPLKKGFDGLAQKIAEVLSAQLTRPQTAELFSTLKTFQQDVTALHDAARDRVKALVLSEGEQTTDTGTKVLFADGWKLEARPQRTGYDPKKVEGLLRAKGREPSKYMRATISYEVEKEKLLQAVGDGALTADEVATCRYDLTYALQTPRKVKEGTDNDD